MNLMIKNILENKRVKSFLWRVAMMSLAILTTELQKEITGLNIAGEFSVVLGLILGEISKWLNSNTQK